MKVYGIQPDGTFTEFRATPFQKEHEEAILEQWLEKNPDGILEDGRLLIIGRQVETNLGSWIDLLALDRVGDVIVIELKRDRTPRDVLAQALEYASFAEQLDPKQLEEILQSYMNDDSLSLAEYHRRYFELGLDEALAFNKDQRIVIVGHQVTEQIRQTASFLRAKSIRVTCVEFSCFATQGGTKLLSAEIVVGNETPQPRSVRSASLPVVTKEGVLESLDNNGKVVFEKLLDFAERHAMPIHWGTKGLSLNVDMNGTHVAICYGYPPASVFKQSIYTTFVGQGRLGSKTSVPEDAINALREKAMATGLFRPARGELKCAIDRAFSDAEVSALLAFLTETATLIGKHGLKE